MNDMIDLELAAITSLNVATFIRQVGPSQEWRGDAALYRLDPPLGDHEYVVVSAVEFLTWFPEDSNVSDLLRPHELYETYIFGADDKGVARRPMHELPGSQKGTFSHDLVLNSAGYRVERP